MNRLNELPERIRLKITEAACPVTNLEGNCWLWNGTLDRDGYGKVKFKRKHFRVHILTHELLVGPRTKGLVSDHLCRVRRCCQPLHRDEVTSQVNSLRGDTIVAKNAAKTHCPRGHALVSVKRYEGNGKRRDCLICRRARERARSKRETIQFHLTKSQMAQAFVSKFLIVVCLICCVLPLGCGAGNLSTKATQPTPISNPSPPVQPSPPPPSNPVPPPVPTPIPVPPTPQLIGQGLNVHLNVVGSDAVLAFTAGDATQVVTPTASAMYTGVLEDLQGGVALTEVLSTDVPNQLLLNGTLVAQEIGSQTPVIAGSNVAWLNGGVFLSNQPNPLPSPRGDFVGLAASGSFLAWVVENTLCDVYLNSVLVVTDKTGCPDGLKVTVANGIVYVGWSDGTAVFVAQSTDTVNWTVSTIFMGGDGVFEADYAVRPDGSLIVAWTEYIAGENGSSVWESDAGGLPVRLSAPVKVGFSGAGNPAVSNDGSIAWLDDLHGSVSGNFDVFLNGADLSNTDNAIDEGPILRLLPNGNRVVAWDDETHVWLEEIPI